MVLHAIRAGMRHTLSHTEHTIRTSQSRRKQNMPAPRLSKSKIISGLQCPKRLYLEIHHPELAEEDTGTEARFATGHAVGEVARQLHPGGQLIEYIKNLPAALK